ncbi:efflux transporter outer membrane subunit [Azospirillum sp. SYSU D00513]|uniref:efflux transporter outer membrane subunit n=1 Tax=Azospirillum sp. SYSU D00513 TaxID=2812561 RepID=UPI001A96F6D2|nr:efflux transporter outer membrane subunit [Azospirillum sp. SYSU D00513]
MRRAAALAMGALLLSGCALGPDTALPSPTLPAAWDGAGERPDALAGVWPDARWWAGFGNAELDRLMAEAAANNRDLAAAASRIRQAEAQARIAGAALLPTLGASGDAGRSWAPHAPRAGNGSGSFGATLQAGYQLDLFGGNAADAEAARASLAASRYDREAVALTLQSQVAATFFQVLAARDRLRLAADTLRIAEDVLAVLERQREVGSSSELEVAQQRSSVATQRAALPALRQSEKESLNALAVLLGRNPQGFGVETRSLADLAVPAVTEGIPSALLQRRPDLRRTEEILRAARLDTVAARAARFPSIDLTVRGGYQSTALFSLLDPAGLLYSVAGSLTAPIFAGGRLEAQEDLSTAQAEELVQSYAQTILIALQDTQDALNATSTTEERRRFSAEAQAQAAEALRIVDARFRAGTVPFLNVLDAQRTVFQANDAVVQATLARFNALVSLYAALGGGWSGELAPLPGEGL